MKAINKYFLIALAGVFLTLTACSDDIEREPSPVPTDGIQAYVYADATSLTYLPNDEQSFVVKVARQKTEEAATVHLSTDAAGVNLPATVDFAAGEAVKDVQVTFDIPIGSSLAVTITIPEEEGYVYADNTVTVNIARDYTWLNIGTGVYTSSAFGQSWPQPIQRAKEANVYKLVDCIVEGYPMIFTLSADNQTLEAWELQETGYEDATYGMTYYSAKSMVRNGNKLVFTMQLIVSYNGGWGSLGDYVETLEFPEGFDL